MTRFIFASPEACIGCRTCELACALEHGAPGAKLQPRLTVLRLDTLSVPVMCHQCENAPCVAVCPSGALSMGKERVEADAGKCIGCQRCAVVCPFGAITIEIKAGELPAMVKCSLCAGRERGPACVEACPTAALSLMTEQQLVALRQKRQADTVSW